MKDATGELSMTAVAVIAIAAIALVFNQLIWPTIKKTITRNTYCSEAFNCTCNSGGSTCTCYYLDENDNTATVSCANNNNS